MEPIQTPVKGVPHALAWNIGTTIRVVSFSETPTVSASPHTRLCSHIDRWV